jgi:hypothetical protein
MDTIAEAFKKDCMRRLRTLEEVDFILESSDTIGSALGMIFMHCSLYPDNIEQIRAIKAEIIQLQNCIDATEVGACMLEYDYINLQQPHRKTWRTQRRYSQ